jgi:hypothetical protein
MLQVQIIATAGSYNITRVSVAKTRLGSILRVESGVNKTEY